MLTFTLAISWPFPVCLIHGPNIPGSYAILLFTALDLLPSPITSTTGHCFHFGSISLFFLELFLHSSPAAYWAPTDLESLSFRVISFCLFILKITTTTTTPKITAEKEITRCRMSQKPWCKIWGLFYNWSAWSDSLSESLSIYIF